jgi:hypothetical protein
MTCIGTTVLQKTTLVTHMSRDDEKIFVLCEQPPYGRVEMRSILGMPRGYVRKGL